MRRALLPLLCALPLPSRAALPPALHVLATDGDCPAPAQVEQALARVLPALPLRPGDDALPAEIADRGDRFEVRVAGAAREFPDAARNCAERARAAAVFIAITIDPPHVELPPPAPPEPPAPPPPAPPRPPPPWESRLPVEIELGGAFAAAPGPGALTGGARLAVAAGARWAGASIAIGGLAPVDLALPPTVVRLARVPIDLAARFTLRRGRVDLAGELGVEGAILLLSGQMLARGGAAARFDAGLYGGAALHVWLSRIGLALGVHLSYLPRPYQLDVADPGPPARTLTVGSTPSLWVGAWLGVVIRARQ